MAKSSIMQKPDELKILESQNRISRHDQIQDPKPCFSAFIDGLVFPQPGERNQIFYGLTAEYRRMGYNKEMTYSRMSEYYLKLPEEILFSPGSDGQGFSLKEVETIIRAVYRSKQVKSYGCDKHFWDRVCIGDVCTFKQKLSGKKNQSFETAYFSFIRYWLNSRLIFDSDLKIYLALSIVESRREFKPGSVLFVSHRELSEISGVYRNRVPDSLKRLQSQNLITYEVGMQRRLASTIQRKIPIPKPSAL